MIVILLYQWDCQPKMSRAASPATSPRSHQEASANATDHSERSVPNEEALTQTIQEVVARLWDARMQQASARVEPTITTPRSAPRPVRDPSQGATLRYTLELQLVDARRKFWAEAEWELHCLEMDEYEERNGLWYEHAWQRHKKLAPGTMFTYQDSPLFAPRHPRMNLMHYWR